MTGSQLKRKAAATIAEDFSTTNVGGAMSATELTGAIAETLFEMPSTAVGSGDGSRVQCGKEFIHNTSDDDLAAARIYFANFLLDWGAGNDTVGLTPSHEDDQDKVVKLVGFSSVPGPAVLSRTLGASGVQVFTGDLLSDLQRLTVHDSDTDDLVPLAGALLVKRGNGTELGAIPAGYYSGTAEIDAWAPGTLNDTTTAATAAADPAGATWTRPRDYASGLLVANSGTLTAGAAQGYWLRWTVKEGLGPNPDLEYIPTINGNDLG